MSHLTQMSGLAVQNFVSAAVGIAVAVALDPRLMRRRSETIGNFWVDLTRGRRACCCRCPSSSRSCSRARASCRTSTGHRGARPRGRDAVDPRRPDREPGGDQGARDERRRARTTRTRRIRSRTPTPFTNLLEIFALLLIPFALTYAYGRLVKDQRQGWAIFAAMSCSGRRGWRRDVLRGRGQPAIEALGGRGRRTWRARRSASARPLRPLRRLDDGDLDGRRQRRPRQLHAARRRRPAREHDARRGDPRRRRCGSLRDARVRAARPCSSRA